MSDKTTMADQKAFMSMASKMPRTISSLDILGGEKTVIIRHGQDNYRLQVTAAGKLILTK